MSNFKGKNITTFQNVNLRGLNSSNPGMLKVEGGGFHGTASVSTSYLDQDVAWTLPAKSGGVPITGTFSVDLQGVAATTFTYTTAVTVSGIRVEDAVTVTLNGAIVNSARILVGAVPSAANTLTLYFINIGCAAAGQYAITGAYTAYR